MIRCSTDSVVGIGRGGSSPVRTLSEGDERRQNDDNILSNTIDENEEDLSTIHGDDDNDDEEEEEELEVYEDDVEDEEGGTEDHSEEESGDSEEDESSGEESDDEDSTSCSEEEEEEGDEEEELLAIKVTMLHTDEIRGYSLPMSSLFKTLIRRISKEYGGSPRLTYIDSENDPIAVKSQKDFLYVLRDYRSSASVANGKPVRSLRLQAQIIGDEREKDLRETSISTSVNYHTVSPSSSDVILNNSTTESNDNDDSIQQHFKTTLSLSHPGRTEELLWQKGELLGAGSYGKVYRCIDSNSGEIIAVKEIKLRKGSKHREQALAMQQELLVLSALDHPNIIRYLGAEYSKQLLRIFLELAPEGSVKDAIREFGAFSEPVVRKYMRDILNGLAFLHTKRFIHRDIKPTNMLINKNTVKLADFGCAVSSLMDAAGKSTGIQGVIGTTVYMSPEVMAGSDDVNESHPTDKQLDVVIRRYGRKADIWSMAVSCVEMAIGEMPFRTAASAIYRVCVTKEFPSLPPNFSADAHYFITRCLVEDPVKRADCEELLGLPFCQRLNSDESRALQASKTDRQTSSTLLLNLSSFNPFDGSQDLSEDSLCMSTTDLSQITPYLTKSRGTFVGRFDDNTQNEEKINYVSDLHNIRQLTSEEKSREFDYNHCNEFSPVRSTLDADSLQKVNERRIRTAPGRSRTRFD